MNTPDNSNWVTIHIPWWPPEKVGEFMRDGRRLMGLHPWVRVERWRATGERLEAGWQGEMSCCHEQTGLQAEYHLTWEPLVQGGCLHFDPGWKAGLQIHWESHLEQGTVLTLREHYHPLPEEPETRAAWLKEFDPGLLAWSLGIRRHLFWRARLGCLPPVRWYLEWLTRLAPFQRRFTRLLVWSSVAELLLLILLLLIWQPQN
ncbi:MAG: hypothetical protein HQL95_06490 [Magnetococcales bacterium]|nr:hypothetical protein [Magnetococcales bacterium]